MAAHTQVQKKAKQQEIYEAYLEAGRLWKRFDEVYRKAAFRAGISDSAFEIFYALYDLGEGCLQRDICAYASASKQTINSSVHKLEKEGLVRFEAAESGRGVRVFFTDKGRAFADARVKAFARADFKVFSDMPDADRRALMRIQRAYIQNLSQAFDVAVVYDCPQQLDEEGAR